MDLFTNPFRETGSISESFSDLPGSLRERIDAADDFDWLEAGQLSTIPFQKDNQSTFDPLMNFGEADGSRKPSEDVTVQPRQFIPRINLEHIAEEQSCELDNSRTTDFNRSTKDNVYLNESCRLSRDLSTAYFLKNRQVRHGDLSFNAKRDTLEPKKNFSMRAVIAEELS